MKRWGPATALVALFVLPILIGFSRSTALLQDSDTAAIIEGISKRSSPLSWFASDWPLENHFYRPISTLSFEVDKALGGSAGNYGFTNALLCALCIFSLFWLIRELSDDPILSAGGAILFAIWHGTTPGWFSTLAWSMAGISLVFGLFRSRNQPQALAAACLWTFVAFEIGGVATLQFRMLEWIPGRTASVMSLFALVSIAAYARYERTSAEWRRKAHSSPLDPPATKGTVLRTSGGWPAAWAILALLALALALGSYEQAVMVPILLAGVAWMMSAKGYRVRWWWIAGGAAVLVAYVAVRAQVLPFEPSGYQRQQFRSSSSVAYALLDFVMPSLIALRQLASFSELGFLLFTATIPYSIAARIAGDVAAIWHAFRQSPIATFAYVGATAAFLPMAWLKPFDHYYYLPMALRAVFVACILKMALGATVNAASPRAIQAPPRQHPAPGSLPRR